MDASPGPLLSLLPANSHLTVLRVDRQDGVILVVASVTGNTAACPVCGVSSRHVHSRYHRTLRDLPFQGAVVRLCLRTRRFYCRSPSCSRNVFAERPAQVAAYGRQTDRLLEVLQLIGYAMGGEAGARLACRLGIESSADTLLRKLKQTICSESHPTVRVLGVDDWAWRKGWRYGTILVDLERKQPVDLLANRDSEAVTRWLENHPEVKIVSRDRAGAYSEGARKGAPHALQIADRFHVLCNLTQALHRMLERLAGALRVRLARHRSRLRLWKPCWMRASGSPMRCTTIKTPTNAISVFTGTLFLPGGCKRRSKQ